MHIRKITVCVRDTTWFVELIAGSMGNYIVLAKPS
jgi:hypothetical protein